MILLMVLSKPRCDDCGQRVDELTVVHRQPEPPKAPGPFVAPQEYFEICENCWTLTAPAPSAPARPFVVMVKVKGS